MQMSLCGMQFPGHPMGEGPGGVLDPPGAYGLDFEGVMSREPSWPAFCQRHPSRLWHCASAWAALKGAQWAWLLLLLLPETSSHPFTPGAPKVSCHWAVASPTLRLVPVTRKAGGGNPQEKSFF